MIEATPEDVFRYITEPEHGPRWQGSAVSTRVTTPRPIGLGSRMEHQARWLGMPISTTGVVTVYEPVRRYGYDISSKMAPEPSQMRYVLEPQSGGTWLRLSTDAPLPGLMKIVEPLLRRSVQRMFERDVARLKAVIEDASRQPGA